MGNPGWLKEGAMWKCIGMRWERSCLPWLLTFWRSMERKRWLSLCWQEVLESIRVLGCGRLLSRDTLRLFLAGFFGIFGNQVFFYTGIALTSAAYAAAMQAAIPIFTFLIAYIFRIEDINFAKHHGQVKLLGVAFSLCRALLMTFYQGPIILGSESSLMHGSEEKLALHTPTLVAAAAVKYGITAWQVGSACLVANTFCLGIYTNLQAPILGRYPSPVSETALTVLFGTLLLLVGGAFTVKDSSAWVLTNILDIVAIAYAGTMISTLTFAVSAWAFQRSGPFLVAAYIPLQPFVSAILGFVFLGDVIYLGSLLGAIAVLSGLYLITWGKVQSKERNLLPAENPSYEPLDSQIKEPLLISAHDTGKV